MGLIRRQDGPRSKLPFNGTQKDVKEISDKTTFLDDGSSLIYHNDGYSFNNSYGHRFGMRLEHKFSEKTSILFQPQFNFGKGDFQEFSKFTTDGIAAGETESVAKNEGFNNNTGNNKNWTANGFSCSDSVSGFPAGHCPSTLTIISAITTSMVSTSL